MGHGALIRVLPVEVFPLVHQKLFEATGKRITLVADLTLDEKTKAPLIPQGLENKIVRIYSQQELDQRPPAPTGGVFSLLSDNAGGGGEMINPGELPIWRQRHNRAVPKKSI